MNITCPKCNHVEKEVINDNVLKSKNMPGVSYFCCENCEEISVLLDNGPTVPIDLVVSPVIKADAIKTIQEHVGDEDIDSTIVNFVSELVKAAKEEFDKEKEEKIKDKKEEKDEETTPASKPMALKAKKKGVPTPEIPKVSKPKTIADFKVFRNDELLGQFTDTTKEELVNRIIERFGAEAIQNNEIVIYERVKPKLKVKTTYDIEF